MGSKCCDTKIVGGIAYTLDHTEGAVPVECLNACVYTKDDQAGSLFCFAKGDLPVQCTSNTTCDKGKCGPYSNTRIIADQIFPLDVTKQSNLTECQSYCRWGCWQMCGLCASWTYDEPSLTCYTFTIPYHCQQTEQEIGWVSGGYTEADYSVPCDI